MVHTQLIMKIEFSLDKDKSNFPLKNFELRDFLDYGDIYTEFRVTCKWICVLQS